MGNSFIQSMTLKHHLAVTIISASTIFEGFKGDVFFISFSHTNLKGLRSRITVTAKMDLVFGYFEKEDNFIVRLVQNFIRCISILKKRTIASVT